MQNFLFKSTSAFLIASGLLGMGATSASADSKVFQADSICRGTLLPTLSSGALANQSATLPVTVYCAINRDRTDLKPTAVQVSVIDNSSLLIGDGNFSCFLTPVSRFGVLGTPGGSVGTSGTNSAGSVLTIPIPAIVPVDGTLTLKCKVPRRGLTDPASVLASIKVIEPDPTN